LTDDQAANVLLKLYTDKEHEVLPEEKRKALAQALWWYEVINNLREEVNQFVGSNIK
jgi:hypothetical protein